MKGRKHVHVNWWHTHSDGSVSLVRAEMWIDPDNPPDWLVPDLKGEEVNPLPDLPRDPVQK